MRLRRLAQDALAAERMTPELARARRDPEAQFPVDPRIQCTSNTPTILPKSARVSPFLVSPIQKPADSGSRRPRAWGDWIWRHPTLCLDQRSVCYFTEINP